MIIVDLKHTKNLESALKTLKQKFIKTGVVKELHRRKEYTKPSVARRNEVLGATYRQSKEKND